MNEKLIFPVLKNLNMNKPTKKIVIYIWNLLLTKPDSNLDTKTPLKKKSKLGPKDYHI